MQYADILIACLGVIALAAAADMLTGRRGFAGTMLVSATGASCGAFLAMRVFAVATLGDWPWVYWAMAGSILCLGAYFLFRSKR